VFGLQRIYRENAEDDKRPVTEQLDWRVITSPQQIEICARTENPNHYVGVLES